MLSTYRAILRGEVLEWLADKPLNLTPERAVPVHVTLLEDTSPAMIADRGLRMAAALENLAQIQNAFTSIDPIQWERDARQDRQLPGRNGDVD